MEWNNVIIAVICVAVSIVGAISITWQIYRMTVLDAEARGLKHPKFWGFFAMNNNNSSGLILYLIGRKRYPVINMSEAAKQEIETRKKSAAVSLVFLAAGAIGLILWRFFLS